MTRTACLSMLVVAATLVACGKATLSKEDLEGKIKAKMSEQNPVKTATCPGPLEGKVGTKMTCEFESAAGNKFDVVVTVEKVEGMDISLDFAAPTKK